MARPRKSIDEQQTNQIKGYVEDGLYEWFQLYAKEKRRYQSELIRTALLEMKAKQEQQDSGKAA